MDWVDNGAEKRKQFNALGRMKETYDNIYKTLDYGPIATARGFVAAQHAEILWPKPCKVLCIGAGNAYEAVFLSSRGYDVTVVDYIKAPVVRPKFNQIVGDGRNLPFKDNEFDLVLCCECMEHIPEEDIDSFLRGVKRITTFFYFTIDDEDDPPYHSHVCIHPPDWWIKKAEHVGFTGHAFKPPKFVAMVDGVPYGKRFNSATNRGFNFFGNKIL